MFLGVLIDAIKGDNTTRIYQGNDKHHIEQVQIEPTTEGWIGVKIISKQVIYHTKYKRWWIPDSRSTVYEVCGVAPPELKERVSKVAPLLFEPVTYPMLCNPLLRWTDYPHQYALIAFCSKAYDSATATQVL